MLNMNKPQGGRGRKVSYTSTTVRVPDPVLPQIQEIIDHFHFELSKTIQSHSKSEDAP